MSAIKRFFQRRKVDVKFKKAGEGHSLSEDTRSTQPGPQRGAGPSSHYVTPTQDARKAGAAAVSRISQPKPGSAMSSIKAQAKREIEAERRMRQEEHQAAGGRDKTFPTHLDTAPVVNQVMFKCSMIGPDVYPKEEMKAKIHEFLLIQLAEEPEMASALMIYTLNSNKEAVRVCVETMCKFLDNLILNPAEEKFRKIRLGNKAFTEKVSKMTGAEEFLQSVGFERKTLPFQDGEDSFLVIDEGGCADTGRLANLKAVLQTAEPIKPELDRDLKVFYSSPDVSQFSELPREFYNITPEEMKREQQIREDAVEKLGMLRTKAMRERDEQRELRRYRYTLIRVRFQEGVILQGVFHSADKLKELSGFVRDNLADDWMPFFLHSSTGQKLTEEELTLAELGLVPAVVVNFSWEPSVLAEVKAQQGLTQMPPALGKLALSQIQQL